ncbi:MAG: hypothetical protein ACREV1_01025 [Gammaproteobacteria bacterium]
MYKPDSIETQRLRYGQGQMLKSRDFRDQATIVAQLRWWHNRALHNAYGVREGLKVSLVEGRKFVRVTCGVAYDCYGRELILQTTLEIPLPTTGPQTLLIRYRETAQFPKRSDRSAACLPGGRRGFWEQPEFVWKPAVRVEISDGVPLAQVSFDKNVPSLDARARLARPLARPRVGYGATVQGGTCWELWSERVILDRNIEEVPVGMQVTIDTSAAGFTETPCYFAWLQGMLWEKSNIEFFPVPLAHIDRETYKRFRLRLWMPRIVTLLGARVRLANQNFGAEYINFGRKQKLYICWIGIQPTATETTEVECPDEAEPECHTVSEG